MTTSKRVKAFMHLIKAHHNVRGASLHKFYRNAANEIRFVNLQKNEWK